MQALNLHKQQLTVLLLFSSFMSPFSYSAASSIDAAYLFVMGTAKRRTLFLLIRVIQNKGVTTNRVLLHIVESEDFREKFFSPQNFMANQAGFHTDAAAWRVVTKIYKEPIEAGERNRE